MSIEAKYSILLVEDDLRLADYVCEYLRDEGFNMSHVADGTQAIEQIVSTQPDLVILDIMLPGTDGVEVCRKARSGYHGPIIMLTAAGNDFAEIAALQQGADSYLNKPIKPQVLLAHVEATLRRFATGVPSRSEEQLSVQDVVANSSNLTAQVGGVDLVLTSSEFELLWLLMESAGGVLSRDELYQKTRGIEHDGLDRSIDLRISQLRKKLGDEAPPYTYIKTIRNKGYQFAL